MQLQQLRYIIAIAEEQNITKAAERMFISQSAMSQQLLKVEKELGTPLFEREGRLLKITKAGQIYVNSARAILNVERAFYEEALMMKNSRPEIRIAVSTAMPDAAAARLVTDVCRQLAGMQVHVADAAAQDPETLDMLVCEGKADIVIGAEREEAQAMLWTLGRCEESFVFAVPEGMGQEEICALLSPEHSWLRRKEAGALKQAELQVTCVGTLELMPRAVVDAGIAGAFLWEGELPEEGAQAAGVRVTEARYSVCYSARAARFGRLAEMWEP